MASRRGAVPVDGFGGGDLKVVGALPYGVGAVATQAIDAADGTLEDALRADDLLLGETFTPASGELARAALAAGVQTREVELNLVEVLRATLVRHS